MPHDPEKARARYARYHQRHRDKLLVAQRAYNDAHREERRAKDRARRAVDGDERRARDRARYQARREEMAAHKRAWRAANRDKWHDYQRLYRLAHPEKERAKKAKYRATHTEEIATYKQAYRVTHPEQNALDINRRRARKKAAPRNDLTRRQWEAIKAHYGHRCVYCGRKMQRLTMDHIIPLSKGGNHTLSNVVPACLQCNSKKGAREVPCPVQPLLLL